MNKIAKPQAGSQIETAQLDIFGKQYTDKKVPTSPTIANKKKFYPVISLATGLNDTELQNDFMLIHRILQRRLKSDINRNIKRLVQLVHNEMLIKAGRIDITTATRTSLLIGLM